MALRGEALLDVWMQMASCERVRNNAALLQTGTRYHNAARPAIERRPLHRSRVIYEKS
jgi:hypothetical protein